MGFSTVIAFSIIVVSFVMVTGLVVSVAVEKIKEINEAYQNERDKLLRDLGTDYELVNVTATGSGPSNHTLEVVITNTGSETLDAYGFTLLVDGKMYNYSANVTRLYPSTGLLITAQDIPGSIGTQHRLKIVSENGISRYASYTVG